jgi:hypothetical protein
MILTVEGTYCPSSGELPVFDFDLRRYVLSVICGLLKSKSYSSPDDGQYGPSQVNFIELLK